MAIRPKGTGFSLGHLAFILAYVRKQKNLYKKGKRLSPRALDQWLNADGPRGALWQTEDAVVDAARRVTALGMPREQLPALVAHLVAHLLLQELLVALRTPGRPTRTGIIHRALPGILKRPTNRPRIVGALHGTKFDYFVRGVQAALHGRRHPHRSFAWLKRTFVGDDADFYIPLGRAVKEKAVRDLFPSGTSTRTILRRIREGRMKKWG